MAKFIRALCSIGLFLFISQNISAQKQSDILMNAISVNNAKYDIENVQARSVPIDLEVFDLQDIKKLDKKSVYNTIMSYTLDEFKDKWSRPTNVHEAIHGINSALSNKRTTYRAFYVSNGKAIWIEEPNILMDHIIPYIPKSLKGYRYSTYFVNQKRHWNDVALYPLDEWSAYIGGAECAVDDYNRYKIDPTKYNSYPYDAATAIRVDEVSGSLEFAIYCTALSMAIKNKDPKYWKDNNQFKNTMKFFLVKAEKVFLEGANIFKSERQDILFNNLRKSEDAIHIRKFLMEEFDGVFLP
jgi:hypothetical protein